MASGTESGKNLSFSILLLVHLFMDFIEIIYRHAIAAILVSVGFVCDQTTSFTVLRMLNVTSTSKFQYVFDDMNVETAINR